jgi:ABC-2 type transport system permease protein
MNGLEHFFALARRAIVNTTRQPAMIVPSIGFPLIFLAMSSAALDRATLLPGFPEVDSFVQWAISATIVQGILFGAVAAGTDMARDVEGGFFERLIASPVSRTAILAGRVAGAATLAFVQVWIFFGIVSLFGVDFAGGLAGVVLISLGAALLAAGFGSITAGLALRTGSAEAVQGSFPLIFVFLFLSSAFFPRTLMNGWFETVASLNPLSYLIEGFRYQVITGFDLGEWLVSVGIGAGILTFGLGTGYLALNGRLKAAHL